MTDSRDIQAELDASNWAIDGYERERVRVGAPVISDEAVEAAANEVYALSLILTLNLDIETCERVSAVALSAAYPYLLAQITEGAAVAIGESAWEQGSSRGPLAGDDEETWMRGANAGIDFAQTVTRAYGKATS